MIRSSYLLLVFLLSKALIAQDQPTFIPVFENGNGPYACYRIPAIVRAPDGQLVAFCEARRSDCNDFGKVDVVMRRSADGGKTWSNMKVVAENGDLKAGNPAPVWDLLDPRFPHGRLFLFYNTANGSENQVREGKAVAEVWFRTSIDNGDSWSDPVNITRQVHRILQPGFNADYLFTEDWRTNALTPGHAIQLLTKPYRGRLYIAANHSQGAPQDSFFDYRAYGFYSDDHGESFRIGATVEVPGSNESIASEWPDGRLIQNTRQQSGVNRQRLVSISSDGGAHWDTTYYDRFLPSPICQASTLLFYDHKKPYLLFSNPQSTSRREHLVLKASPDAGKTWTESRLVWEGDAAYSDLVQVNGEQIGLFFEKGNQGGLFFTAVTWSWLQDAHNSGLSDWIKPQQKANADRIRLSPPIVSPPTQLFSDRFFMEIKSGMPGNEYYYTEDGKEPDRQSQRYYQPLEIKDTKVLKIRAFNDAYLPSETITRQYTKIRELPALGHTTLENTPDAKYPGHGAETLTDQQFGSDNFGDGSWLGFEGGDCVVTLSYSRPVVANQLVVSCLSAPGSWIMPPAKIEVYTSSDGKRFDFWDEAMPGQAETGGRIITRIDLSGRRESYLKVVIKNFGKLPADHPGAGNPAWLFVDEVMVN
ncbi:MAG: exo-alpha-sialidase [Saprospiraceae bacterium]|nr:exo-alpha-sialidase [Saprospiraceae bacterium]